MKFLYSKRWMRKSCLQDLLRSDVLVRKRNSRFILLIDKFHHDLTNCENLKFEMGPKTWGRTVLVFDHHSKRPKNQYKLMKEKQKHKKSLDDFYGKLSIIFKNKNREVIYKSGLQNETKELEPLEKEQNDIILLNDKSKNFGKTRIIFNRQGKKKMENDKKETDVHNFGKCLIKFDRKMKRKGFLACKMKSNKNLINSRNYLDMLKSKDVDLKNVLEKNKPLFISKKDKNWKPSATRIIMDKTKQNLDKLIMMNNDPQCGFVAGVQEKTEENKEAFVFEDIPPTEKRSKEEIKKFFNRKYKPNTQKKKFTTLMNDPTEVNAIASNQDKYKISATRALLDKSKQNLERLAALNNDPRMGFTNSIPKEETQNLKKDEQSEEKIENIKNSEEEKIENIKNSEEEKISGTSLNLFKTKELSFKNFLNLLTGMKISEKDQNKEENKVFSSVESTVPKKPQEEEELKNDVAVEPLKAEKEEEVLISVEKIHDRCNFLKPEAQENLLVLDNEQKMPNFESNAEIFDFMDQAQKFSEAIKDNEIEGFEVKAVLNSANDILKQTHGEIIDDIVKSSTKKVEQKAEEGSSGGNSELKNEKIQMKMNSDFLEDRPKLRLSIEDDPKVTTYERLSLKQIEENEKTQSNIKSAFENIRNDFPEPLYKSITKDRLKDYKDFAEKFEKMGLYKKQPKKMLMNGIKDDRKRPLGNFKRELEVQEKFKNTPEGKRLQEYFDSFRFKLTTSMKDDSKRRRMSQEKKFFISTKLGKLNPPTSPSKPSFSRKSKDSDKPLP